MAALRGRRRVGRFGFFESVDVDDDVGVDGDDDDGDDDVGVVVLLGTSLSILVVSSVAKVLASVGCDFCASPSVTLTLAVRSGSTFVLARPSAFLSSNCTKLPSSAIGTPPAIDVSGTPVLRGGIDASSSRYGRYAVAVCRCR